MARLRDITGNLELLERFVASYEGAGGFPLDMGYARRCRAYAFMGRDPHRNPHRNPQMIGGFLINDALPFRAS